LRIEVWGARSYIARSASFRLHSQFGLGEVLVAQSTTFGSREILTVAQSTTFGLVEVRVAQAQIAAALSAAVHDHGPTLSEARYSRGVIR
jgi:hypothetical protein